MPVEIRSLHWTGQPHLQTVLCIPEDTPHLAHARRVQTVDGTHIIQPPKARSWQQTNIQAPALRDLPWAGFLPRRWRGPGKKVLTAQTTVI